jgi:hypothetical protein
VPEKDVCPDGTERKEWVPLLAVPLMLTWLPEFALEELDAREIICSKTFALEENVPKYLVSTSISNESSSMRVTVYGPPGCPSSVIPTRFEKETTLPETSPCAEDVTTPGLALEIFETIFSTTVDLIT